jgi:leader peptidase (prepilin peptidase)/N-methyltransferase
MHLGFDARLLAQPAILEGVAFLVGLVVGSFANVCIHRLPLGRSIVFPPSACPACDAHIRPWDNIPLVSYLALRGRCRACRTHISPRYPLVEAVTGLAWWGVARVEGPSVWLLVWGVFVTALLVLALIDLDHQILPDLITIPGVVLGVAQSFMPGSRVTPLTALAAALGGYLVMAAIAKLYQRLRGVEGLGQGDWKLVAMLGAFLGWQRMLLVVFLASTAGTVVGLGLSARLGGGLKRALPLGTFLGAAGILTYFAGDGLLHWYAGFFPFARLFRG